MSLQTHVPISSETDETMVITRNASSTSRYLDTVNDLNNSVALADLDPATLQNTMMKSIYLLEAGLFSQAIQESERIPKIRELISKIEVDLTQDDTFKFLSPNAKIKLLEALNDSLKNAEGFTLKLHSTVAESLEAVNNIGDKMPKKDKTAALTDGQKDYLVSIRNEIARRVKEQT